jgi:hypothetical protein
VSHRQAVSGHSGSCDRKCLSRHLATNGHEVLIDEAGYELDVAYRRGIGTVQVPNRGPQ